MTPTTEQFRNARNAFARALGWMPHIEASHDGENEKLRVAAVEELSRGAATLGFDLVPKLGEPVRG